MNKTDREYSAVSYMYQQIAMYADELCAEDLQLLADLCMAYKAQKTIKFPLFPQRKIK